MGCGGAKLMMWGGGGLMAWGGGEITCGEKGWWGGGVREKGHEKVGGLPSAPSDSSPLCSSSSGMPSDVVPDPSRESDSSPSGAPGRMQCARIVSVSESASNGSSSMVQLASPVNDAPSGEALHGRAVWAWRRRA